MRFARPSSQLPWLLRAILSLVLLLAGSGTAIPACNRTITSGDKTWAFGVPDSYQITVSGGNPQSYNATGLPPGLTVDTSTGLISGTPTAAGTYPVTLSATYNSGGCTTITKVVTFTINAPVFAGFRLLDFATGSGSPNNPRLMLQVGANGGTTTSNRFNATLEVDVSGNGTAWVPYDRFVGIDDVTSWITDAPLPVRNSSGPTGVPQAFGSTQLLQSPPDVYMKADPRATRFGVFQMDTALTAAGSRITLSLWPNNDANVQNGFGGTLGTDVEHVPNRFSSAAYYPATLCINPTSGLADPPRDTSVTTYADNDGVTRPADAIYPDPTVLTTGSSTPYYATTSTSYHPIILNRPFRSVAELGYAFRDLPWKTLDFFTDKSADAGLLDIFCIHDGPQSTTPYDGNGDLGNVVPTMVAGKVNANSLYVDPNTNKAADAQSILAGAIWDEISSSTVAANGSLAQTAETIAKNIATATSTTPMRSKAELVTRAGLPTTILPTPTITTVVPENQSVKARREVVARAASTVSQSRVWNLLIDVVAQSGHYKANATSLTNDFVVEGEQHYWVHVAIDRFTGQVLDKQIEVVNE